MPSSPNLRVRINAETFAITAVTHQRLRIFQRSSSAEIMLAALFRYREQGRFALHAFSVMPDHLHFLLTPSADHSIERCVQLFKGGFSFAIRKDHPGEIWQDGYHAHRVVDHNDYGSQLQYIANNPTRKNCTDYLSSHLNHPQHLDPTPPAFH